MMLRRQLSDETVEALLPLFVQIIDDWELQVEIRDEAVTIYYRGAALLRDVRLDAGTVAGSVHYKYVPLQRPTGTDYLRLSGGTNGFTFESSPDPLPLLDFEPDVIREYKRMMKSVSRKPEADIVHGIVSRPENRIIDQELTFEESGQPERDKIDVCHFDTGLNRLALVEVKGIHDSRLRSKDGDLPEVIDQLRRYRTRIEACRDCIVSACEASLSIKRRLGFGARLEGVPESGPLPLMKKPVLVIGGCSRDDVKAIQGRTPEWNLLIEGLEEEAAGLILCGQDGCNLDLRQGPQCLGFDPSIF